MNALIDLRSLIFPIFTTISVPVHLTNISSVKKMDGWMDGWKDFDLRAAEIPFLAYSST